MATYRRTHEHYVPGSLTLAQRYCTSVEVFHREVERIFKGYWYCAGHESRIPEAGEYLLLAVSDEGPIVVGDQQGRVSSGAYAPGWYTPRESLLAAFDRHYLKIMGLEE